MRRRGWVLFTISVVAVSGWARTYEQRRVPLVPAAGQVCLPEGLKSLVAPPGVKSGASGCVTQVWLDGMKTEAARDFYRTLLHQEGWDVANPHSEGKHHRFTAARKKQLVQFDFYPLVNDSGTRLEITESYAQTER